MNYSEMSDFEINCAVAEAIGQKRMPGMGWEGAQDKPYTVAICGGPKRFGAFAPCSSWDDAGPIIQKYGIAIAFDEFEQEWVAFSEFRFDKAGWDMEVEPKKYHHNKDPLRAAMIVFLMMQEAK